MRTLAAFGFEWDGPILRQSARAAAHRSALEALRALGRLYPCDCTRRTRSTGEDAYPGTCRRRTEPVRGPHALRVRVDPVEVAVEDRIQGLFRRNLAVMGDFIVRRRDGIVAYALAVVVDDAALGVTDVVRGADLLQSTGWQIALQEALRLPQPRYGHLPLLTESGGAKLAKRHHAAPLDARHASAELLEVLRLLGQAPPADLEGAAPALVLAWASGHWRPEAFHGRREIALARRAPP